jgi:hypothetical protein
VRVLAGSTGGIQSAGVFKALLRVRTGVSLHLAQRKTPNSGALLRVRTSVSLPFPSLRSSYSHQAYTQT